MLKMLKCLALLFFITICNAQTESTVVKGLINSFSQASETTGDILVLYGQVLDINGKPVPEAIVEIWQTDASGAYDHPNDPSTDERDLSFQFFGQNVTNDDGWYVFRTIVPGEYEPRPRHIHYKVKQDGKTLLTSQFYFTNDIAEVEQEDMFQAVGDGGNALLLQLIQGEQNLLANGQIVVNINGRSGSLKLTPSQAEGPYYPVVDLSKFDNDLTTLD